MTQASVDRPLARGQVGRPESAAAAMRAVTGVAAGPPVVTVDGDRLRVESFSPDHDVYARFDLLAAHLDTADASGPAAPAAWVTAFAEVAALAPTMAPVAEVAGDAVARFLGSLPMFAAPGADLMLAPAPGRLRHALSVRTGSILLTGSGRLRSAVRIAHLITRMRVHRGSSGATGWLFDLPGGRLTLLLSARPARGFGDGFAAIDGGRVGYDLDGGTWFHRETTASTANPLTLVPDALV